MADPPLVLPPYQGIPGIGMGSPPPVAPAPTVAAAPAPQPPSTSASVGPNQAAFINKYRAAAEKVAAETGIPAARILAQAGFESGWNVDAPGNNLFGIKAGGDYKGKSQTLDTHEADAKGNLVPTKGDFRVYDSPEESFADWANLIKNKYSGAVNPNLNDAEYAQQLQKGGYGTDPAYASKLHGAISLTRQGLGMAPDGSSVPAVAGPGGGAPAPPSPAIPGLLAASTSAPADAAAAAAEQKQQAGYAALQKAGMGLLGSAETPGSTQPAPAAPIHRPQAQPVALPDFLQILAQQRLKQGQV